MCGFSLQCHVLLKKKGPCVAGICCRVLAQALEQWRGSASGIEPDRHVQVKDGLASARYRVGVFPESRSRRPSPHEDCLAEETFVHDVRGGVPETERVKQARREEVQWCLGVGVGEPVLPKSPRWVDTDMGDANRPNCRSRLVVRGIKKAMKKSDVPSAAELFSGMPPPDSVKPLLFLFVSHNQEEAKGQANSCNVRHQPCALP